MASTAAFSHWRTIGLMGGLMMGVLLSLMDQTVVSTAMPTIADQLGGLDLYAWVFSAYMLSQTAFLTIFGKLSGAMESLLHSVFWVGLALFAIALPVSLFMRGSAAAQPAGGFQQASPPTPARTPGDRQ